MYCVFYLFFIKFLFCYLLIAVFSFNPDDLSLCWFLRGCKFDLKKTKARIETFYNFRSKVTEWYSNRDPLLPELTELLNLG
jgi:hypothetical protein